MKAFRFLVLAALLAALFGCASLTPTREISHAYAIYDIQAGPEVPASRIAEAVKVALQQHASEVRIVNGIPPSPLPEKAPRFQLVSPLKGELAALAAASGQQVQMPACVGAILTANASETSKARYGEGSRFFAFLMP